MKIIPYPSLSIALIYSRTDTDITMFKNLTVFYPRKSKLMIPAHCTRKYLAVLLFSTAVNAMITTWQAFYKLN